MTKKTLENLVENILTNNGKLEMSNSDWTLFFQDEEIDNPELKKAFKKSGGCPDTFSYLKEEYESGKESLPKYTIKFLKQSNTILIFDLKNEQKNHWSTDFRKNKFTWKPKKYAVDSVLYFAGSLKKYFNVLAVAVSGENAELVSTFRWLKGHDYFEDLADDEIKIRDFESNKIHSISEYKSIALGLELTNRPEEIRNLAIEMHDKLRELSFTEKQKPLFIANILIALNSGFNYVKSKNYNWNELKNKMKEEIQKSLVKNNVLEANINYFLSSLETTFESVKLKKNSEKPNTNDNNIFWYFDEIKNSVLPYYEANNQSNEDVLAQFYHEFIKYSGGDGKGLGIVLTPSHITKFMAQLIDVNGKSKIIDIACGTGSFLISSLHLGVDKKNIYGIELQSELHNLAIANMIMNKDGKSKIYSADSLDEEHEINLKNGKKEKLLNFLRKSNIDKALLNPPYSQVEQTELMFALKSLDILEKDGKLAIIVPVSCAMGVKFKNERLELMNKHTLEGVISMPRDLFYPTASTNTCIMIWTAKVPHPKDKETFFALMEEDGYRKNKKLGRVPNQDEWNSIYPKYLDAFKDNAKENIPGLSIWQNVNETDEWLAETYIETDYTINEGEFEKKVREYLAFKISTSEDENE